MKMRFCYKITITGEVGKPEPHGMCFEIEGVKPGLDYRELASLIDKQVLIDNCCLTGIVSPEQMELMDPDEFDKEFPDLIDADELQEEYAEALVSDDA